MLAAFRAAWKSSYRHSILNEFYCLHHMQGCSFSPLSALWLVLPGHSPTFKDIELLV